MKIIMKKKIKMKKKIIMKTQKAPVSLIITATVQNQVIFNSQLYLVSECYSQFFFLAARLTQPVSYINCP